MSRPGYGNAVVLGAGPAGLAAAVRLAEAGVPVTVLEKAPSVGGLAGSVRWRGHVIDYGPHTMHVKKPAMTEFVQSFYGDDPSELLSGEKEHFVYVRGKMFTYPLSAFEVMRKLNPFFTARAVLEFLLVSLIYKIIYIPEDNFESWGIRRFGKALYNLCFGSYTEKVWKMPARQISYKFASDRVRGMDLKEILRRMLRIHGQSLLTTYWTKWIYPKAGSFDLYERMKRRIEAAGGRVLTDMEVSRVRHADGKVREVEFSRGGAGESMPCDWLVSTIPLGSLMNALEPAPSDFALYHASKLHYRSLILVCIEVKEEHIYDAQLFYLLDKGFECNRISLPRNVSPSTVRDGANLIVFEISCAKGDALWRMKDEELIAVARRDMERVAFMRGLTVTDAMVARVQDAYEVYDLDFDKHLDVVLDHLAPLSNCITTGRKGLFLQNDIHDSLKMGLESADLIIKGRVSGGA